MTCKIKSGQLVRLYSLYCLTFHKSKKCLNQINHLFVQYMNLWFIILKVQHESLKKSNSRSNEIQLYKNFISLDCSLNTPESCTLGDSLWITFTKLYKLFYCLSLFQDASNSWPNGQPSERTVFYKQFKLKIQIQLKILIILSPSCRVLEKAVQVNQKLFGIFAILV